MQLYTWILIKPLKWIQIYSDPQPQCCRSVPRTKGSGRPKNIGSGTLVHLHHSSKIKSQKEVTRQQKSRFFYYFCLMMEGFGVGSVPLTNGSGGGSGRPKNKRIRWMRIRNTAYKYVDYLRSERPAAMLLNNWVNEPHLTLVPVGQHQQVRTAVLLLHNHMLPL